MVDEQLAAEEVTSEVTADGVGLIKINRPRSLNALNSRVVLALSRAITKVSSDPNVAVIVIAGGGEKAFVAGADISEMQSFGVDSAVAFSRLGQRLIQAIEMLTVPVIAAVQGHALGGGAELAIACDFVWASAGASFGFPEVSLGVTPGFGGTARLPGFVGEANAKELVFSGRRIDADEAQRMGLVNRIFPKAGFLDSVMEACRAISANSRSAVAAAKALMVDQSRMTGPFARLDAESLVFGQRFGTVDQKEGMSAFLEKRRPQFGTKGGING